MAGNTGRRAGSNAGKVGPMADTSDIAALSFEQALAELEKIVSELESGQAPLERSIEV